jgi:hypothetical protein
MDIAGEIPEHDRFQADFFHEPAFARNLDDIAHPDLIFQENEEPADHVLYQTLGSKTDRQSDDPDGGEKKPDFHSEFLQDHHGGHDEEGDNQNIPHNGTEGLGPLLKFGILFLPGNRDDETG